MDSRIPLPGGLWGASFPNPDGFKGGVCITGRKLEIQKWGQRFLDGRKACLCQTVTGSGWVQPEDPQAESPSFGAGKGDSDLSHTGIMAAAWHEA